MPDYMKHVRYKSAHCNLRISEQRKIIRVMDVRAEYKSIGHGTGLMLKVCEIADEMGMDMILWARPHRDGPLDKEMLKKFYSNFGFRVTVGDNMLRERRKKDVRNQNDVPVG